MHMRACLLAFWLFACLLVVCLFACMHASKKGHFQAWPRRRAFARAPPCFHRDPQPQSSDSGGCPARILQVDCLHSDRQPGYYL